MATLSPTTVPDVCYAICDNAFQEAQAVGKVPALCETGSAVQNDLAACQDCVINANGASASTSYLDDLAPYIDYCSSATAATATVTVSQTPTIPASYLTYYGSYTLTPIFALPSSSGATSSIVTTVSLFLNVTSTLPAWYFHLSVSSLVATYIPPTQLAALASEVATAASAASVTGNPTSLLYDALEATSAPAWFASAIPPSYTAQMVTLESEINELRATPLTTTSSTSTATTATPSSPSSASATSTAASSASSSQSKAWIAGVVVGVVVGLCMVIGVFVYVRRHNKRKRAAQQVVNADKPDVANEKPQLHSDHLQPRYELDGSATGGAELVGSEMYPEMAVNEVAAQEMAAGKMPNKVSRQDDTRDNVY